MRVREREIPIEGPFIYGIVAYETVALTVNFIAGRRILPPLTALLGPLTRHRWGRVVTWLFLGFWYDHFYRNGEIRDLILPLDTEPSEPLR